MSSLPFDFSSLTLPTDPWGPSKNIPKNLRFSDIPYAPFSKSDKLGKAADWQQAKEPEEKQTGNKNQKPKRDQYHAYGASAAASFAAEAEEDVDFSIVDSNGAAQVINKQQQTVLSGRKAVRSKQAGGKTAANASKAKGGYVNNNNNNRQGQYNSYNSYNKYNRNDNQIVREASVRVESNWNLISDIEFNKLTKLNLDVKSGEDVTTYGVLNAYSKKFENLRPGFKEKLQVLDREIFNPTTQEDPIIKDLASKKAAKVFATDAILAQLMCSTRSVYPWDIIVTKKDGAIYFDKRDNSLKLDVDENSQNPPSLTDNTINSAGKLSLEATFINHNFVADVLDSKTVLPFEHPENPFVSESELSEPLLNKGYRYRKFSLPEADSEAEPLEVIVRCEIDSFYKNSSGENVKLSVNALNQYNPGNLDWQQKLNQNRGAIVADELKKNKNKVAKWVTKAVLAGSDEMKLGFVARTNPKDNTHHVVLGVSSYPPETLGSQISLSIGNGWGVVKSFIDIIEHEGNADEYKFVIMKDPNAQKVAIYKVPYNSFEESTSEEKSEW